MSIFALPVMTLFCDGFLSSGPMSRRSTATGPVNRRSGARKSATIWPRTRPASDFTSRSIATPVSGPFIFTDSVGRRSKPSTAGSTRAISGSAASPAMTSW
jgi:hypothetical protein